MCCNGAGAPKAPLGEGSWTAKLTERLTAPPPLGDTFPYTEQALAWWKRHAAQYTERCIEMRPFIRKIGIYSSVFNFEYIFISNTLPFFNALLRSVPSY